MTPLSATSFGRPLPVLLLGACVAVSGCSRFQLPDLGPCSVLPTNDSGDALDAYEFGQIDIGTCLSAPTDLQVRPDPTSPRNHFVVAVNSNASSNFVGSSLLSIDASSIDLTCPVNGMHELRATALTMQEFAGRLAVNDEGLGILTSRQSGGLDGDLTDPVYVVDLSDPRAPRFDDRAPRSIGPYRYVSGPADPWSVVMNETDGRAYILGLTTHEVYALDLTQNPIQYVDLVGERSVRRARFTDADGSGSDPDFDLLAVDTGLLENETLRVTLAGGTVRMYYPALTGAGVDGLFRADSGDAGASFVPATGGADLEPTVDWAADGLGAVSLARVGDSVEGLAAGTAADGTRSIGRIQSVGGALDMALFSTPSIEGVAGAWDGAGVFDPEYWLDGATFHAFWSGGPGFGEGIGHAEGGSLSDLVRFGAAGAEDGLLLGASDGWDDGGVFGPSILQNGSTDEWMLFYTGYAEGPDTPEGLPPGLAIGLALGDDPASVERTTFGEAGTSVVLSRGEAGDWDDVAVAQPAVLFRNGRFHMWYQGFDGVSWATGLAHSVDGIAWIKDARNPVFDGVVDRDGVPRRAYVSSAAEGGYYFIEGDRSGELTEYAQEGPVFEGTTSPITFRIVGGQALGRGDAGDFDATGVGSPSPTGTGGLVAYLGHDGGSRRAALAEAEPSALVRAGTLEFEGFEGIAAGLNGPEPTAVPLSLDVRTHAGVSWAAVQLGEEVYLASGDLTSGNTLSAVSPGPVLTVGEAGEFDDEGVAVPALLVNDAGCRLFYEGFDGLSTRIGVVQGATCDALSGTHVLALDRGAAGTWDDGSVRSPTVVVADDGVLHLWYIGSDGETDLVGHATSADDGATWIREKDPATAAPIPVFDPTVLAFAGGGFTRLAAEVVISGFQLWFEGVQGGVRRIGRARSPDGVAFQVVPNPTTAGDFFEIETRDGDASNSSGIYLGDSSIDNSPTVDGIRVHAAGASDLVLSPDRKFALIANKRAPYIIVADLFDDSTDDYLDANHRDIEAVISLPQVGTRMVGVRELRFSPDGQSLYATLGPLVNPGSGDEALRRGPEGLLEIDWSDFTDEPEARAVRDSVRSFIPLARGSEEPEGYADDVSVGPLGLTLNGAGDRAYVANFNDNSFWILDLKAGARGAVVAMVDSLDERPSEVALSPDETLAYVSTSFGVLHGSAASSTMHVVDIDERSETFGQVLTTLSNVGSREAAGCTGGGTP